MKPTKTAATGRPNMTASAHSRRLPNWLWYFVGSSQYASAKRANAAQSSHLTPRRPCQPERAVIVIALASCALPVPSLCLNRKPVLPPFGASTLPKRSYSRRQLLANSSPVLRERRHRSLARRLIARPKNEGRSGDGGHTCRNRRSDKLLP